MNKKSTWFTDSSYKPDTKLSSLLNSHFLLDADSVPPGCAAGRLLPVQEVHQQHRPCRHRHRHPHAHPRPRAPVASTLSALQAVRDHGRRPGRHLV